MSMKELNDKGILCDCMHQNRSGITGDPPLTPACGTPDKTAEDSEHALRTTCCY